MYWMRYFCKNSLRARYIRNALVGMADFPGQYSHYIAFPLCIPCDHSWDLQLVRVSQRCWLWLGIMILWWCGNLKGKRFNTLYGRYGSFYILKLDVHRNNDFTYWSLCVAKMRWAWLTLRMQFRLVDRFLRFQSRIIKRVTINITEASTKSPEKL